MQLCPFQMKLLLQPGSNDYRHFTMSGSRMSKCVHASSKHYGEAPRLLAALSACACPIQARCMGPVRTPSSTPTWCRGPSALRRTPPRTASGSASPSVATLSTTSCGGRRTAFRPLPALQQPTAFAQDGAEHACGTATVTAGKQLSTACSSRFASAVPGHGVGPESRRQQGAPVGRRPTRAHLALALCQLLTSLWAADLVKLACVTSLRTLFTCVATCTEGCDAREARCHQAAAQRWPPSLPRTKTGERMVESSFADLRRFCEREDPRAAGRKTLSDKITCPV